MRFSWIVFLFLGLGAAVCRADEGWSVWRPFGGTVRQTLLGGRPVNQNMPAEPSLIQRVGSGTKSVWTGTRDLVTYPFREKPQPKEPIWGQTRIIKRANNEPEEEGFLTSMFWTKKEPKKPETVVDWMKQPKPKF